MSKTCNKYKTITDKYGRRIKRCASFTAESTGGEENLGQLPEVWEGFDGFDLDTFLGPAVGGGAALGVSLLTRAFSPPESRVGDYAGLIGAGAGILLNVPVGFLRGWNTAIAGMMTALLTGLNCYLTTVVGGGLAGLGEYGLITPEEVEGYGLITPEEVEGLGLITPEEVEGLGQDIDVYEGLGEGGAGAVEVLEGVNLDSFGTNIVS